MASSRDLKLVGSCSTSETASRVSTAVWLQSGHFRLVFGAARKAGILPPEGKPGPRVTHIGFGLVLGEDGKRFRTRSSEVPSPCTLAV